MIAFRGRCGLRPQTFDNQVLAEIMPFLSARSNVNKINALGHC
jgi:hypothetical protein